MRLPGFIPVLLLALSGSAVAKSAAGDRVLVVIEDTTDRSQYSQLWEDLEARQFHLTFESPKSDKVDLLKHGELSYDHLILTPPKSKGYGPSLTPKQLLEFNKRGGNVLLGLTSDSNIPSAIASLLLEFDISLPTEKGSVVVDHFNYDQTTAAEQHDTLVVHQPNAVRPDVINFFGGSGVLAVPHSVAQTLGNTNPLLTPILKAPETSYVHSSSADAEEGDEIFATGSQISLVTALQARNSARFTVVGSLEMLQNKWFDASVKLPGGKSVPTANKKFAQQLTEWTFKEVGVLKVGTIEHHEVLDVTKPIAETNQVGFHNPSIYRIKNDVAFSIELSLWDRTLWVPYTAPVADAVQLEFSMLSPFQRLPLSASSASPNSTYFSTMFRLPDQHGIFAFKVNYKRPFLTNVEEKRQVTVRHFAHDEWPRSWKISGGWPWIGGLWSVIGGFVAFVVLWLYCEPPKVKQRS